MRNSQLMIIAFSVIVLSSFVSADWFGSATNRGITGFATAATNDGNLPASNACSKPVCADGSTLVDTGNVDSSGCVVYACQGQACSMPVCSDGSKPTDAGQKDSAGCTIYKCPVVTVTEEEVKCVFNSKTSSSEEDVQECSGVGSYYTTNSGIELYPPSFSCKGVGSCVAQIKGPKGMAVAWKSSCGGYAYTTIDGDNEYANFYCQPPPTENVTESVKCVFNGSAEKQECYGRNDATGESFSCAGTGTCVADVSGAKGSAMAWKSTCGGYAYTKLDGENEYANFYCEGENPKVEENVKCIFDGADTEQKCYATSQSGAFFVCTGVGSCVTSVAGPKGEQLAWGSSCGSYAYTIIDGAEEYAKFKCLGTRPATVSEQVKCVFNSKTENTGDVHNCYGTYNNYVSPSVTATASTPAVTSSASVAQSVKEEVLGSCSGSETCVADVKGFKGTKVTWKSDCGGYAYTVIDGENEYANFYCAIVDPPPREIVSEQVKCVFANNGSEGPTQKCYNTDYVVYPGASCSGTDSCVIDVKGPKGKVLEWASSCKGYASTRIDGDSEYATFDCGPSKGGQVYALNFSKSWNLISIPASNFETKSNSCKYENMNFYKYNKAEGKYEKVSATKAGDAYWANNPDGPCTTVFTIIGPVPLSSLAELGKGWNFVAVVPEMIGSSIESLGDCDLRSAYSYNAEARKWVSEIGKRITDADLGNGLVVYSNNACSLAVSGGPPPLPNESSGGSGGGGGSSSKQQLLPAAVQVIAPGKVIP